MGAVVSKVVSESLLSLYPVFVKSIDLPIEVQMWARVVAYAVISWFFIDSYVWKNILSGPAVALAVVNVAHIYTSYRGFQLLDSGPAYTLFYIYPIFILLLSGRVSRYMVLVALGVYLTVDFERYMGIIMIVLAAITEALMYFCVKRLPSPNPWNHLFLSCMPSAVIGTVLLRPALPPMALGGNALIGLVGYYLRFYAIHRLDAYRYAVLSYVGIAMSYVYGWLFFGTKITLKEFIGSILIFAGTFK